MVVMMKKLISNRKIAVFFDIAALIAIAVYAAVDNDAVDAVCLVILGIAILFEIAYRIAAKKRS